MANVNKYLMKLHEVLDVHPTDIIYSKLGTKKLMLARRALCYFLKEKMFKDHEEIEALTFINPRNQDKYVKAYRELITEPKTTKMAKSIIDELISTAI